MQICGRLQLGTGVTGHRLQSRQVIATQFLAQALNSTLSGRGDGVAGEAKAKAASRMAQRPQMAQAELSQFNGDLFRSQEALFLGFIKDRMLRFSCKVECTQYHDGGLAATSRFLAPTWESWREENYAGISLVIPAKPSAERKTCW
jgi:hypothetical protein